MLPGSPGLGYWTPDVFGIRNISRQTDMVRNASLLKEIWLGTSASVVCTFTDYFPNSRVLRPGYRKRQRGLTSEQSEDLGISPVGY